MIPSFDNNPCFELFSAATEVIKYWKLKGKFSKEFEPHSKSNIYYLNFGSVSSLTTPIDEKHSLQIKNSCLLFQFMLYNIKSFSIEICVRDKTDTKRRFNLTSSVKEIESKNLYIKIPFNNYPMNIWTNLLIDLSSLIQHYLKTQTFKNIDSIHISGNLKIRKIFSLRSKDEPVLRSLDMGKSTPLVNLLFTETGDLTSTNIKIIGAPNPHINTVNIDSRLIIENKTNKRKGSPSPPSNNNHNKYSTTSDITMNRHKQIYPKKNKPQYNLNNINNINLNINVHDFKKDNFAAKMDENKQFLRKLQKNDVTSLANDIKYKKQKINVKNINGNNLNSNEEANNSLNANNHSNTNNSNNNSNNAMKNNFMDKGKNLGKLIQNQKKKRNKSNNPFTRPKINNNKKNENLELKEEKFDKKLNNINSKVSNKKSDKIDKIDKIEKNNKIKDKDKDINHINYYNSKEKEISLEDYTSDTKDDSKFKFNNILLGSSLSNKNKTNEEEKESNIYNKKNSNNIQNQNKFSNYNMLIESGIDIKNIPIYDSIEEVAEWPGGDWNAPQGEGVGDKLIRLDNTKKIEKNDNNINLDDDDLLEFASLEKKETYRPYTPPIEELVQVNPNKMKGDSNMKASLDKKSSIKTNKTLKNYENLIYNEEKGLLYDPLTNKYYDIKAKYT